MALFSVFSKLVLIETAVYSVFYFILTLFLISRKRLLLAYRTGALVWDVGVLILLVILQVLHLYSGVRVHLMETTGPTLSHLIVTGITILPTLYFLFYQTYVIPLDVVLSGVLLFFYSLDGVLTFFFLCRLARSVSFSGETSFYLTSYNEWQSI
ncbi:transmembrane protein 80-like [Gasterosteus aculeatus]|uniref:Transmembrane protein 80 n=1 Tax=Gasterosteus aculeatus aculeatus TaxID=481459 RepID=A0AAQ4QC65_GASAC